MRCEEECGVRRSVVCGGVWYEEVCGVRRSAL